MADCQVTNVRKDRVGAITHIGVRDSWELSEAEAIRHIEAGLNTFFVMCPIRADVIVKWSGARKYLATTADSTTHNNLDSLPPL